MKLISKIKNLDFIKARTSPIGLDIGFDYVRMIQLRSFAGRTAVIAADETQLPVNILDDKNLRREYIISAIRKMLIRGSFQTRKVVSSIPSSDLIIKNIRVDAGEDNEIDRILSSQAVERCGLKPQSHEIRFFSAGSVRQGENIKNEIILLAVNKTALDKHINILEEAGVVAVGIEAVPCALFRSFQRSMRRTSDLEKANVFVDVGGDHTTVIIGRGGEIIFAKQIDIASEHISREIASKLGISIEDALHLRNKLKNGTDADDIAPAMKQIAIDSMNSVIDDLAKEISLCFRYYSVTFRGSRPVSIVFAGSDAYEKTIISALKKHLEVEVEITEPLRGFDISNVEFPSDKRDILCEWAVAAGLSMKGFSLTDEEGSYERN